MNDLKTELTIQTNYWIDFANERFGSAFIYPQIDFSLRGTTAGRAKLLRWGVQYNMILAKENQASFINRTVPHEVAHLVAYALYKDNGHGRMWKHVMRVFGKEPTRCHSYDVSNARVRRTRRFAYTCNCDSGKVIIGCKHHNKIQKAAKLGSPLKLWCLGCKKNLTASDLLYQLNK